MKRFSAFLVAAYVFCACTFSVGTNKDLRTGLSYNYKGFSVEEVLLVGNDNVAKTNNEVQLGDKIAIMARGIANYELKNDKAFPGLMLSVTDKDGSFIVNEADVFAYGEGYPATDASILSGKVTTGFPMKSGETYHVNMRIWDKNKPGNEITAEIDLVVR